MLPRKYLNFYLVICCLHINLFDQPKANENSSAETEDVCNGQNPRCSHSCIKHCTGSSEVCCLCFGVVHQGYCLENTIVIANGGTVVVFGLDENKKVIREGANYYKNEMTAITYERDTGDIYMVFNGSIINTYHHINPGEKRAGYFMFHGHIIRILSDDEGHNLYFVNTRNYSVEVISNYTKKIGTIVQGNSSVYPYDLCLFAPEGYMMILWSDNGIPFVKGLAMTGNKSTEFDVYKNEAGNVENSTISAALIRYRLNGDREFVFWLFDRASQKLVQLTVIRYVRSAKWGIKSNIFEVRNVAGKKITNLIDIAPFYKKGKQILAWFDEDHLFHVGETRSLNTPVITQLTANTFKSKYIVSGPIIMFPVRSFQSSRINKKCHYDNGGCKHVCIPKGFSQAYCMCSNGVMVSSQSECHEDENMLININTTETNINFCVAKDCDEIRSEIETFLALVLIFLILLLLMMRTFSSNRSHRRNRQQPVNPVDFILN